MSISGDIKPTYGAFGIYRWILASIVALSHSGMAFVLPMANWSVRAFFILSGYVACYTLKNAYLHKKKGIWRYYGNRALRIYPSYWVACLLVVLLTHFLAGKTPHIPHTLEMWMRNISAIGLFHHKHITSSAPTWPVLLPTVSWSIGNEIIFWLLMPFICFSRKVAVVFIAVGLWLHVQASYAPGSRQGPFYFSPRSAALYFGLGYLIAEFRSRLVALQRPSLALAAAAAILFLFINRNYFMNYGVLNKVTMGYVAVACSVVIIMYLSTVDTRRWSQEWRQMDLWMGRLAYGVFLMHIPMKILVRHTLHMRHYPTEKAFVTLICANVAAFLCYLWVERPIEQVRRKLKNT